MTLLLALVLACPNLRAHEGHDNPGAMPPAPHGGMVKEAAHKVAHKEGAPEDELFFEVTYKNNELKIYPLLLSPENTKTFKKMSPGDLAKTEIKVEFPRAKKTDSIAVVPGPDAFAGKFDAKGANRFIVHVLTHHNKEEKLAKIQLENR